MRSGSFTPVAGGAEGDGIEHSVDAQLRHRRQDLLRVLRTERGADSAARATGGSAGQSSFCGAADAEPGEIPGREVTQGRTANPSDCSPGEKKSEQSTNKPTRIPLAYLWSWSGPGTKSDFAPRPALVRALPGAFDRVSPAPLAIARCPSAPATRLRRLPT